jgi:hypothetical protein
MKSNIYNILVTINERNLYTSLFYMLLELNPYDLRPMSPTRPPPSPLPLSLQPCNLSYIIPSRFTILTRIDG